MDKSMAVLVCLFIVAGVVLIFTPLFKLMLKNDEVYSAVMHVLVGLTLIVIGARIAGL